jgi:hypothetical protein
VTRIFACFLLLFACGSALAAEPDIADLGAIVNKAAVGETKSECLARARKSRDEIIICGAIERYDRFRLHRSGTPLIVERRSQSPAERALETRDIAARSQAAVGFNYRSTLADTVEANRGKLRRTYATASNLFLGRDPDLE